MRINKSNVYTAIITIILTAFFILFILPKITKLTGNWGLSEIAIVISVLSLIIQMSPPFIENKLEKKTHRLTDPFYTIDLNISVLDEGNVSFGATIENKGLETIIPQYTKLYIDQGLECDSENFKYDFPFVLEHTINDDGSEDCMLCKRCKNESERSNYPIDAVPQKYKTEMTKGNLYTACFNLEHLSKKSIKYIQANERFQEDIIVKFSKSGVYRAILIVITENADCQCATKQFYISDKIVKALD